MIQLHSSYWVGIGFSQYRWLGQSERRAGEKSRISLPDIEPVYMSEKNSNHVKEIDDI